MHGTPPDSRLWRMQHRATAHANTLTHAHTHFALWLAPIASPPRKLRLQPATLHLHAHPQMCHSAHLACQAVRPSRLHPPRCTRVCITTCTLPPNRCPLGAADHGLLACTIQVSHTHHGRVRERGRAATALLKYGAAPLGHSQYNFRCRPHAQPALMQARASTLICGYWSALCWRSGAAMLLAAQSMHRI